MKTLELFCGTKSFSKVMQAQGHSTITIDINAKFNPTYHADILTFEVSSLFILPLSQPDFIWASPPCQAFSVASIGKSWTGGHRAYIPKSENAILGLKLLDKTIQTISELKPKYWCIENPRGVMRKVIDEIFQRHGISDYRRVTIMYCRYGDLRMKPTDIWTNIKGWGGRQCKNRNTDHQSAPRGAKTGTQGLKGAEERSVIPPEVFEEIIQYL